jgi:hypothetical protein
LLGDRYFEGLGEYGTDMLVLGDGLGLGADGDDDLSREELGDKLGLIDGLKDALGDILGMLGDLLGDLLGEGVMSGDINLILGDAFDDVPADILYGLLSAISLLNLPPSTTSLGYNSLTSFNFARPALSPFDLSRTSCV